MIKNPLEKKNHTWTFPLENTLSDATFDMYSTQVDPETLRMIIQDFKDR